MTSHENNKSLMVEERLKCIEKSTRFVSEPQHTLGYISRKMSDEYGHVLHLPSPVIRKPSSSSSSSSSSPSLSSKSKKYTTKSQKMNSEKNIKASETTTTTTTTSSSSSSITEATGELIEQCQSLKRKKMDNNSIAISESSEINIISETDHNISSGSDGSSSSGGSDGSSNNSSINGDIVSVQGVNGNGRKIYKRPEDRALVMMEKRRRLEETQKPQWHAPWKLKRVISGHLGWVRALSVDCSNEWFASGATDRTIKIWDLASGVLKLTLTGHISTIRDIAISSRSPYLFSVGEDKSVRCWDLEQNKQIRQYHGHLSGVYCCCLHPKLDLLFTGGRDSTVRVWDIRTKAEIFCLAGHDGVIASIAAQSSEPQLISGSLDATVRCWDLAAGKTKATLTHHKKGVRSLCIHPSEYTFASASLDNIKRFKCPEAQFLHNFSGHNKLINSIAVNQDDVLVSGADDGSMYLWDWKTGYNFQQLQTIPQPGSLDSEAGILVCKFDHSGYRLLTGEVDKTIKVWAEDPNATEESHPIQYEPSTKKEYF